MLPGLELSSSMPFVTRWHATGIFEAIDESGDGLLSEEEMLLDCLAQVRTCSVPPIKVLFQNFEEFGSLCACLSPSIVDIARQTHARLAWFGCCTKVSFKSGMPAKGKGEGFSLAQGYAPYCTVLRCFCVSRFRFRCPYVNERSMSTVYYTSISSISDELRKELLADSKVQAMLLQWIPSQNAQETQLFCHGEFRKVAVSLARRPIWKVWRLLCQRVKLCSACSRTAT